MSSNDSFIDEVSEEVRRDRLFGYMRRYGWIAVLAVLVLVGAAAWSEWSKAQNRARAEALGDALLSAMETEDAQARVAALEAVTTQGPARAVADLLTAAEQEAAGDSAAAVATLQGVADDASVPQAYRTLATLKALMIGEGVLDEAARRAGLSALAVPGQPYRTVAQEQLALALLSDGDRDGARVALESLVADAESSEGLRERARGLIVALDATRPVAAGATEEGSDADGGPAIGSEAEGEGDATGLPGTDTEAQPDAPDEMTGPASEGVAPETAPGPASEGVAPDAPTGPASEFIAPEAAPGPASEVNAPTGPASEGVPPDGTTGPASEVFAPDAATEAEQTDDL